jgi:hypothetical protein
MTLHLILHGLAVKKHADAGAIAEFVGVAPEVAANLLADAVAHGRVIEAQGKYMLAPLTRVSLAGEYSREYGALRGSATFVASNDAFERVNVSLKALITEWQTITVGGSRVSNTHSDPEYDMGVIDRLGELHERADRILGQLAGEVPRFEYYRRHLREALERAEGGAVEWVSDARILSFHTLWFELHEDLLRILGRQRSE